MSLNPACVSYDDKLADTHRGNIERLGVLDQWSRLRRHRLTSLLLGPNENCISSSLAVVIINLK